MLSRLNTDDDEPIVDDSLVSLADELVLRLNLDDPVDVCTAMNMIKTVGLSPKVMETVQPKIRAFENKYLINVGA